jgi:hypothetical protein
MTDFLKANQSYNATLSGNYTVGDTTLSVSSVPSNVPSIVTVARGTTKETRFTFTGTGVNQLTGVTRLDGANDNISSGSAVECMNDADFVNQLSSAVFTQNGLKGLVYAADGGASDAYAISLPVAPTALSEITGLPIAFKANTANTGAATLAVNGLTAKTIKKNASADLETGDVLASQIVLVVYDGTNFQLVSTLPISSSYVTLTGVQTLSNKRMTPRVVTTTDDATAVIDCDITDQYQLTAVANATEFTVTGTPTAGQKLIIRVKDAGVAKALTFTGFTAIGVTIPTTTVVSKTTYVGAIYNATASTWDVVAVVTEA